MILILEEKSLGLNNKIGNWELDQKYGLLARAAKMGNWSEGLRSKHRDSTMRVLLYCLELLGSLNLGHTLRGVTLHTISVLLAQGRFVYSHLKQVKAYQIQGLRSERKQPPARVGQVPL